MTSSLLNLIFEARNLLEGAEFRQFQKHMRAHKRSGKSYGIYPLEPHGRHPVKEALRRSHAAKQTSANVKRYVSSGTSVHMHFQAHSIAGQEHEKVAHRASKVAAEMKGQSHSLHKAMTALAAHHKKVAAHHYKQAESAHITFRGWTPVLK